MRSKYVEISKKPVDYIRKYTLSILLNNDDDDDDDGGSGDGDGGR